MLMLGASVKCLPDLKGNQGRVETRLVVGGREVEVEHEVRKGLDRIKRIAVRASATTTSTPTTTTTTSTPTTTTRSSTTTTITTISGSSLTTLTTPSGTTAPIPSTTGSGSPAPPPSPALLSCNCTMPAPAPASLLEGMGVAEQVMQQQIQQYLESIALSFANLDVSLICCL